MQSIRDAARPFPGLTRRRVLQLSAAGGAGLALAACTPDDPGSTGRPTGSEAGSSDPTTSGAVLPSYQAVDLVTPDLVSDDPEVPVAFLRYPADPPQVTDGPPLAGAKPVTAMTESNGPIPAPAPGNTYWAELNRRIGTDLQISMTPPGEYIAKFQTVMSGKDIPEICQIKFATPRVADLLDAKFLDLTPILGGDAILKYPFLAAIPEYAWKACVINGKLRGIPFSQPRISNGLTARLDIVEELGLSMDLRDGDDFLTWCRDVTDARANRWALQRPTNILGNVIGPMMGAPNVWRVEGGKFISQYETEEYASALAMTRSMVEEGLFHPDAFAAPTETWLAGGQVVTDQNGLTAWTTKKADSGKADFALQMVRMPKWDGGGLAPAKQGTGIYTAACLAKTDDEARIDELLRLINWIAAPFGSAESMFRTYGIEGEHYTLDGTDPIPAAAAGDTKVATGYIGRCAPYIYFPGASELTEDQFSYHADVKDASEPLPTVGLTSETERTKSATIQRELGGVLTDILTGNKTMDVWADTVARWKSEGGDQIAAEYEEALQQQ